MSSAGGVPGVTTGYAGSLDAQGEAVASVTSPSPVLTGLPVWTGFFTIDPNAFLSVKTISNSHEVEFQ